MVRSVWGLVVVALSAGAATAPAQQTDSLPQGVTAPMVEEGGRLFAGAGLCAACHGPQAKGVPNLGPDLTDAEWLHSKGTYEDILKQIETGVSAEQSKTGTVMPPRGGSQLTEAQMKAVAAYVWTLSHGKKR